MDGNLILSFPEWISSWWMCIEIETKIHLHWFKRMPITTKLFHFILICFLFVFAFFCCCWFAVNYYFSAIIIYTSYTHKYRDVLIWHFELFKPSKTIEAGGEKLIVSIALNLVFVWRTNLKNTHIIIRETFYYQFKCRSIRK